MNKRQIFAVSIGIISLVTGILAVKFVWLDVRKRPPIETPVDTGNITIPTRNGRLSGPFTYKNLTIFLIHGETSFVGKTPLTLEQALTQKLAIVHETSDVNELSIENVSKGDEIYVQAGDIVKGGQQDRVLGVDLIVPARSGEMPIDAFCVEHGRWTQRGNESPTQFNASTDALPSKDIKLAAKCSKSQAEVWSQVDEQQTKL